MTIEAVNSVLSNAPYTRAVAEQQSVANSYAANPERVQQAVLQAPYLSLYIKVDVNFDKAILQIRDGDTGDVVRQIPSEAQLEAYRRAQSVVAPKIYELPELKTSTVKAAPSVPDVATKITVSAPAPSPQPQQNAQPQIQTAVVSPPAPQVQQAPVSFDA